MKTLAILIILTLSTSTRAQIPAFSPTNKLIPTGRLMGVGENAHPLKSDSLPAPSIPAHADWSQKKAFHMILSGGVGTDFVGTLGTAAITTILGQHVVEIGYVYTSDGSFAIGTSGTIMSSGPPTLPDHSRSVYLATYGQRITPQISAGGGFAWVDRTTNIKDAYIHQDPGFFSDGGSYWQHHSQMDSYPAAVVSLATNVRAYNWWGFQFRAEVFASTREVWGNMSVSIGLGNFPTDED